MNKVTITLFSLTCSLFGISASTMADTPQHEFEIKDEQNVFVTIDDEGKINVQKSGADRARQHVRSLHLETIDDESMIYAQKSGADHARQYVRSLHQVQRNSLSVEAANCIIKNISKVNTERAAHLLKQACETLHPNAEQASTKSAKE